MRSSSPPERHERLSTVRLSIVTVIPFAPTSGVAKKTLPAGNIPRSAMRPAGSQISDRCQRLGVLLASPRGSGHGLRRLAPPQPALRCEAFTRFRKPTPSIYSSAGNFFSLNWTHERVNRYGRAWREVLSFGLSSPVFERTVLPASRFLTAWWNSLLSEAKNLSADAGRVVNRLRVVPAPPSDGKTAAQERGQPVAWGQKARMEWAPGSLLSARPKERQPRARLAPLEPGSPALEPDSPATESHRRAGA